MRFRLRTLLILLAILPPLLWIGWGKYQAWKAEQDRRAALLKQKPVAPSLSPPAIPQYVVETVQQNMSPITMPPGTILETVPIPTNHQPITLPPGTKIITTVPRPDTTPAPTTTRPSIRLIPSPDRKRSGSR